MDALIIKTKALLSANILKALQKDFAEQLKSGVVVIPSYLQAELINIPEGIEVIVQSETEGDKE